MKLKELKERLKDAPDDAIVLVRASDSCRERCWQEGEADDVFVDKRDNEVWIISNDED